jgi:hypothetical protein
MFRALLCPSSGASSNCLCSLWLPYDCRGGRVSSCGRFTDHSWKHVHPGNHTVTSGCKGSWRGFLMMGTIVPETCLAVSTRQSNKYKIDCASSWIFLLNILLVYCPVSIFSALLANTAIGPRFLGLWCLICREYTMCPKRNQFFQHTTIYTDAKGMGCCNSLAALNIKSIVRVLWGIALNAVSCGGWVACRPTLQLEVGGSDRNVGNFHQIMWRNSSEYRYNILVCSSHYRIDLDFSLSFRVFRVA